MKNEEVQPDLFEQKPSRKLYKSIYINIEKIRKAYVQFYDEHKYPPTIQRLTELTKLSYCTIKRLLVAIKLTDDESMVYKIFTPSILHSIAECAKNGSIQHAKLHLQLHHNYTDPVPMEKLDETEYEVTLNIKT